MSKSNKMYVKMTKEQSCIYRTLQISRSLTPPLKFFLRSKRTSYKFLVSLSVSVSLSLSLSQPTLLPDQITKLCYNEEHYATLACFLSFFLSLSKAISHKHTNKKDDYTDCINIKIKNITDRSVSYPPPPSSLKFFLDQTQLYIHFLSLKISFIKNKISIYIF
jgi:hypothetical protein